jgi:hypothetical protein
MPGSRFCALLVEVYSQKYSYTWDSNIIILLTYFQNSVIKVNSLEFILRIDAACLAWKRMTVTLLSGSLYAGLT